MTDKATPRPWRVSEDKRPCGWASIEVDTYHEFKTIGSMYMFDVDTNIANAALIVRAVNNFDQMKTALEATLIVMTAPTIGTYEMDDPDWYARLDAAVKQARAVLAKIEEK